MRISKSSVSTLVAAVALALGFLHAMPASADSSIGAGYFAPGPDQKGLGVIATTGLTLPIVPIAPQVALAVPFSGGRYALTGEARVALKDTYLGVGAGIARLQSAGSTGAILDAFIGHKVAPLTSLEARFYGAGDARAGSTGYIGVRFAL